MGISNDILFADKKKRVKRPPDYVDPPEVLALQRKYYDRWVKAGRHSPTQATMAFALACARRVHEHPEMSNRAWVHRMKNIYVARNFHNEHPEHIDEIRLLAIAATKKKGCVNRLAKDRKERTPFAFDESAKAGKDLLI
jgi:hypothetical protein